MSPQELVRAERQELARLWECPVMHRDCEYCGHHEWHAEDGDDFVCLACAKARIESMADAANDVVGYERWKQSRVPAPQEPTQ